MPPETLQWVKKQHPAAARRRASADDRPDTCEERLLNAYIRTVRAAAAAHESRAADVGLDDPAASENAYRSLSAEVMRLQGERQELLARLEAATRADASQKPKAARRRRKVPSADWLARLRQFHGFAADYAALAAADPVLTDTLAAALAETAGALFSLPLTELLPLAAEIVLLETVGEAFHRLDGELRQALAAPTPDAGERAALIKEHLSRQRQLLYRLIMEVA